MSARNTALLAATMVSLIYGVTFSVAKDVMPQYIAPFGFITLRVGGSVVLFWLTWLFMPKEKIAWNDFPRIVAAAFFGVALNMLTFFKGLSYTSPISAAVIMVTTPMIVLLLSAVLLRERMQSRKILGILLGLGGTASLIYYGKHSSGAAASNETLGNLLVFINAVSYAFYLIVVRKLMDKYNAFTFVKWIYLFGFLMVLPFGWEEFNAIQWTAMPVDVVWKTVFVVVFSTFLTYLLNLLSMKTLKPVTVAVFIYLQPLFASLIAIGLGKDSLSLVKMVSATLIFTGVYLVTQKPRKASAEVPAKS